MEAGTMRIAVKLAWMSLALGLLIASGGCGKKPQADADAPTAAVKGDSTEPQGSDAIAPKALASDRLHPVVVMETSLGSVTVTLDAERAPITVRNFLNYVNRGHYDSTIFHQVTEGYVVIGGGFTADLKEKPADSVAANEAYNHLKNRRATIAMARSPDMINSARSQFFFNVADNPQLDFKDRTIDGYGYCVFGEVTQGMEAVDRIAAVKVEDKAKFEKIPVETVLIKSIRQVR
jgi:cyclophilin family peptidyl-prolyl cis-trans isomerase